MSALHRIKIEEIRNLELIEEITQVVLKYKRNGILPNDAKIEEKSLLIYLNNRYSIYNKYTAINNNKYTHIDDHLGI
jgi:hypothetical protein